MSPLAFPYNHRLFLSARLSLSANLISQQGFTMSKFPFLVHLEFLGLFGNGLSDFDSLLALLKNRTPHLKEIHIAANPCTMMSSIASNDGTSSSQDDDSNNNISSSYIGATGLETTETCKKQLVLALPDLVRIDGIPVSKNGERPLTDPKNPCNE
jgi:hypothetical protein